ncbi:hypothetical protein RGUI_0063 (plasmid) [Rhodovulum sp. P5]|uniref:hypothetical protein n=1 Tax=Rhodovulum sp. P5 TaxID=1564506 RepID=UPI0009C28B5D|nr:hypothetical protein [Rhodovulum sp. P5]ARE42421.1 hypothetical protein RGUI_0063 [Rhodovulum sp. P5]
MFRTDEVSGDENAFAQMLAAAVGGEREDALIFALALMGTRHAFEAVQLAEEMGFALLGLVRAGPDGGQPSGLH